MAAPYSDCVCQSPEPIFSYIMKFYSGEKAASDFYKSTAYINLSMAIH